MSEDDDVQGDEMGHNIIYTHFTGASGLLDLDTREDYSSDVPGVGPLSSDNEFWKAFVGNK
jgi:hypothetical protein